MLTIAKVVYKIPFRRTRAPGLSATLSPCMQDTFARATLSAYRPSARVTIGYLAYNLSARASKGILHIIAKVACKIHNYSHASGLA